MLNYKVWRKKKAYFLVGVLSLIIVWGCNNQAKQQELEKQKQEDSIRIAEKVKKELEEQEATEQADYDKNTEGKQQQEVVDSNSDEGEYVAGVLKKGNWAYSNTTDPMTDEVTNAALCMSNEALTIYDQRTYLQLYLMHLPSGSNSVFVQIENGVLRQDKLPMIYFRFDGGKVETFAVIANGAKAHLIPNEQKANDIINSLKKSKKCAIKVEAQDGGTATFTFNTEGLEWNY